MSHPFDAGAEPKRALSGRVVTMDTDFFFLPREIAHIDQGVT